jgi:hypothetical protein
LAQTDVSGIERGGDGPFADRDGRGDRPIVKIGVIAKEENETLPLRELLDGRPHQLTPWVVARPFELRPFVELVLHALLGAGVASCVHDNLPHPSIQIAATLEAMTLPHRTYERFMDDVGREIRTTDDRRGNAAQLGQPALVHRSQVIETRPPATHPLVRLGIPSNSFIGPPRAATTEESN